jgi:hypothetical protein
VNSSSLIGFGFSAIDFAPDNLHGFWRIEREPNFVPFDVMDFHSNKAIAGIQIDRCALFQTENQISGRG